MVKQERAERDVVIGRETAIRPPVDRFEAFLRQEFDGEQYQAFAGNLEARGWLSKLEQVGIVPGVDLTEVREQALQRLYLGAILGELDEQLLLVPTLLFTRDSAVELFDDVSQPRVF